MEGITIRINIVRTYACISNHTPSVEDEHLDTVVLRNS